MPELPEVERARKLIQDSCKGYKISSVETTEDKIVYTGGADHAQFAKELEGRTIMGCERKGKTFWITLSGEGRLPVLHFGMTGMVQLKGQEPTWYRRRPRERSDSWPPRFWKFVVKLEPQDGSVSQEPRELAFMDGRRLARLRLLPSPVTDHAPVSLLGFDPILSHPTLDEFKALIEKKKGTTKGMIMNQAFSAGVGNWVADEVLYQARIHPSCPVNLLTDQNVKDLHFQLRNICQTAVDVNADHMKFPSDWLFRWRWSKGQKQQKATKARQKALESGSDEEGGEDLKPKGMKFLALPDGSPATITFIEVSGRTTAVVSELQKMPEGVEIKPKITKGGKGSQSKKSKGDSDDEGSSGSNSSDESEVKPKTMTPRQKAAMAAKKAKLEASSPSPVKVEPKSTKRKAKDEVKLEPTEESTMPSKKPRKSASGRPSGDGGRSKPGRKGRGGKVKRSKDSDSSELSDAPE